jgi:hypothetical protein
MSNPAFRRFGNPGFLRKIKPKNLMCLLRKFAVFFESKGINVSGVELSSAELEQLSAIIVSPPTNCPGDFLAAVDLLEMLTSGPGIDELRVVVPDLVKKVQEKGDTVGDIVLKVWILDSNAIQRIYTRFSLKRDRTMKSFRPEVFEKSSELNWNVCNSIAKDLEFGCSDLFDIPICEVMAFPEATGYALLIRHGERVKRVEVFDDDHRRDVKALRPVKHDVGFFDTHTGELLVSGRSDEVKNTYRQVFSKHLFGDINILKPSRRFTLDPLRSGRDCLIRPELETVAASRLRKLILRRKGTTSITTHQSHDVYQELELRGHEYIKDFDLVKASFSIHLAWERRVLNLMISPEDDKIQGDIHDPNVRMWMDACKFIRYHEHDALLAMS